MAKLRYNVSVQQRNERLRSLIAYVAERTQVTGKDIEAHLKWMRTRVQNATHDLVALGLLVTTSERVGKGLRTVYSLGPCSEHELDMKLPVTNAAARAAGLIVQAEDRRQSVPVKRDILDTYLMGPGEAPSLIFRRKNAHQSSL
jgi:predicted transcriptional regulator